ncbi:MAG: AMP-binding protein [Nocardioides sp.]|nr:AMP-binding protein [Nocardioides sp.]
MTAVRLPIQPDVDHFLLGGRPGDTALITASGEMTYAELRQAVEEVSTDLGSTRRLVMLEAANDVRTVVTFLAALAGHHPVLLVGEGADGRDAELCERYAPATRATASGLVTPPGDGAPHDLHPDLALLLSTSGSTGSPKLVRLSRDNVLANARSIGDYLGIRPDDRAITSLPLHYCYGLSVLTSHLLHGAAVVLTDLSVSDACFWDLASRAGVSSFAGVPYTFDLLTASGFADRRLPSLRYVTQAGGRMSPERVEEFATLGRRQGWDLFVMYGQTEATARMAYLPPDLAVARSGCIGVPVPGGSFRLEPVLGLADAELVYTGPNVMMGYAESAADLAKGAELTDLRTGDLARQHDDGLWEVTGRLGRHAKVFGVRLDLDRLERQLDGLARLVTVDDAVHAFVTRPRIDADVRRRLAAAAGIPAGAVRVHRVVGVPMTASGKPDFITLTHLARSATELGAPAVATSTGTTAESLRAMFAVVLGQPDAAVSDSFVSLGGDSLSFVEVSTRLGKELGTLPADWQHRSLTDLADAARPRRRFTAVVEMPALLRALAITLVVITHTDLVLVPGGAHVLLAVAGFNLARFALADPDRHQRVRNLVATARAVAVPAGLWIGACVLFTRDYRPATAVFLNGLTGERTWSPDWQFWFLETLVWSTLGLAALLTVPWLAHWQHRHRFRTALAVVAVALTVRLVDSGVHAGPLQRYSTLTVLWCLALGWAVAEARTVAQRATVAVVTIVATVGFFGDLGREVLVATGILLLMHRGGVVLPRLVSDAVGLLAGASLWIYLTHWQVYPGLEAAGHPVLAVAASLVVGIAATWAYDRLRPLMPAARAARRSAR